MLNPIKNHKFKRYILFLIIILSSAFTFYTKAHGAEKKAPRKRLGVIKFDANNAPASLARIVRNNVEINFFKDSSFDILEQSRIDEVIDERQKQLAGCKNTDCAVKLGKIMKSDYIIIGSVDKLDKYTINIKVVDVKKGKVIIAESGDAEELSRIKEISEQITKKVALRIKEMNRPKKKPLFRIRQPLHFTVGYIPAFPMGYLSAIADIGHGAVITARVEDLFVPHLFAGLDTRFLYFSGKGEVHHLMMVPVMAQFGYRLLLADLTKASFFTRTGFSIVPVISLGISYNINYYYTDIYKISYVKRSGTLFALNAGVEMELQVYKNLGVELGVESMTLFERGGTIGTVNLRMGIIIRIEGANHKTIQ